MNYGNPYQVPQMGMGAFDRLNDTAASNYLSIFNDPSRFGEYAQAMNQYLPVDRQVVPATFGLLANQGSAAQANWLRQANSLTGNQLYNPQAANPQNTFSLGFNPATLGLGIGVGQLGIGMFNALQANKQYKLARQQSEWQKKFAQRNLTNQVSDFNRRLESQVNRAAQWNGQSADEANAYLNKHKLSDKI